MALISLIGVFVDGPLDPRLPTNTAVQVDWPRGTDATIDLCLYDQDAAKLDLDLTGADRLELALRSTQGGDVVLSKLATKQTALALYTFTFASNDTIDFSGMLIMDVWATKAGVQRQVISPSYFNVTMRMRAP